MLKCVVRSHTKPAPYNNATATVDTNNSRMRCLSPPRFLSAGTMHRAINASQNNKPANNRICHKRPRSRNS